MSRERQSLMQRMDLLLLHLLLLSILLFHGNECSYYDGEYHDSFPRHAVDQEEEQLLSHMFRSPLQSPTDLRPRLTSSNREVNARSFEAHLRQPSSHSNRGFGSRVRASSSQTPVSPSPQSVTQDLSVSPDSRSEQRELSPRSQSVTPPFLEIAGPAARSPAAILPLGQDIRDVLLSPSAGPAGPAVTRSQRPHYVRRKEQEVRSRADFAANPLLVVAHSPHVDEPDPRFISRNFRRPPQRYSRPFAADHLLDDESPRPTSPVSVEVPAPDHHESVPSSGSSFLPMQPHSSSQSSSSASQSSLSSSSPPVQSNARRYPNYFRNADSFDRDAARKQLADQRATELRMQEEERIKDEMRRLEDTRREEERIRLENDRRLAEEERARNDRRETSGLRLEAELNEKRDGLLRQQERARDRIQTAKEEADRISESYIPVRNGRRPFDPEDHLDPGLHDPDRHVVAPAVVERPAIRQNSRTYSRSSSVSRTAGSSRSATTLTASTTTTTTTTTTTAAPPSSTASARLPRPAGRPGGRRFIGRHRVTSDSDRPPLYKPTPPSTTTTAAASEYEDEYEDDYDYATTTTKKPKRRRNRKRSSTTTSTTPSTTAKTLSPGYKNRADGRIIDFLADPNFPFELKGADLTDYPFYVKVPDNVVFDCKDRHDGYYANVDLHCQIYHHCAIGHRYDFLCPNYTLFDQTTFTCRFINTVNCGKSANFYNRNLDLYVESTTPAPQENNRRDKEREGRFKKKKQRNRNRDRDSESSSRSISRSTNNNDGNDNRDHNHDDRSSNGSRNKNKDTSVSSDKNNGSANSDSRTGSNNNNNDNNKSNKNNGSDSEHKSANERNGREDDHEDEDEYDEDSRS